MTIGQLIVHTWTPSRYAKWKECAAKVKWEDLLKLCPKCFKGRVSGGYDGEPVVCDTCDEPQPEREAMDRGNRLDSALTAVVKQPSAFKFVATTKKIVEQAVAGKTTVPPEVLMEAVRHPVIFGTVSKLHAAKKKDPSTVLEQESFVLNSNWQRVSQFTKNAWARLKLDVLVLKKTVAEVLDWKSGNIDRAKGEIREKAEYHDSMRAYQLVVLATHPKIERVTARMVFLDAPPKLAKPFKDMAPLTRADLDDAKRAWLAKIEPMMNDRIFAPRPGYYCTWCPFSKDKGGPCPHSGQRR